MQRFDERGCPINLESRTEARRLRRAQNEVLSTVGLCVSRDEDARKIIHDRQGADREKVAAVIEENELGLELMTANLAYMFLSLWWTFASRGRLQVGTFLANCNSS